MNKTYRDHSVQVQTEETVTGVEAVGGQIRVKTKGVKDEKPHEYLADAVVGGLGVKPNVDLAQAD